MDSNENEVQNEDESERILNKIVESIEKRLIKAIPFLWTKAVDGKVEFKGVVAGDGGGLKFEVLCNYDESRFKMSNRPSLIVEGYNLVDDVSVSEDGPEQLWIKLYRTVRRLDTGHNEPPKEPDKENDADDLKSYNEDDAYRFRWVNDDGVVMVGDTPIEEIQRLSLERRDERGRRALLRLLLQECDLALERVSRRREFLSRHSSFVKRNIHSLSGLIDHL